MKDTFFTIGMAGHIDHGKTTLTKALTGVDTDRLKEEKERNISIEPGFAPLQLSNGKNVSIVDVPGHERFIRQMIAGVAGIDLVLIVIAGDEGVMPQTKEHLQIVEFLGISHCIVVVTKVEKVEDDILGLVTEDIKDFMSETTFKNAPIHYIDSISGKGIPELLETISNQIEKLKQRDILTSFRLPIDQAFTLQGHGTIVRGTVFEGVVTKDSNVMLLPQGKKVKVRQIQVHHQVTTHAIAGQRAAINIAGVSKNEISRGNVLVDSTNYHVTKTIDVALRLVDTLSLPLKQRSPIKLHIGTSETFGTIVFFDRNEVKDTTEEILCQIRLESEIVVKRGDRFILRRPTPVETLGGGWVIQPLAGKYKFGEKSIKMLSRQKESSPQEIILDLLKTHKLLTIQKLVSLASIDKDEILLILTEAVSDGEYVKVSDECYSSTSCLHELSAVIVEQLREYHIKHSMRIGISKAELLQVIGQTFPKELVEYSLEKLIEQKIIKKEEQYLFEASFHPSLPKSKKKIMEQVIKQLQEDELSPKRWEDYCQGTTVSPQDASELRMYLLKTGKAVILTDTTLLHSKALEIAVQKLRERTNESFSLSEAKDILGLSRKYLIPFLELLDKMDITSRVDGNREWNRTK
ncbi:selenocysteine-specific translation elongation factor [Fredinandcohnia humi]